MRLRIPPFGLDPCPSFVDRIHRRAR
jgi:hypothetical protein